MVLTSLIFTINGDRYIAQLVPREAEDFEVSIERWKLTYVTIDYETGHLQYTADTFCDIAVDGYSTYEVLGLYMDLDDDLQDFLRPHLLQKGIDLDEPYVIIKKL